MKTVENEYRSKQISVRLTEDDYQAFKRYCHHEYRSMADVTYEIIKKIIAKSKNK